MAYKDSIGMVEVIGFVTAYEVADAMLKAAHVEIKSFCTADAGLVTVTCEGDLASCQAAVEAGKAMAARIGEVANTNVIPRPFNDLKGLMDDQIAPLFKPNQKPAKKQTEAKAEESAEATAKSEKKTTKKKSGKSKK